jgi:NADPH2:quinone reductase
MLVLGAAGSTGSAAVQLGKAFGMRVIAAASSAERREFCLEAGADAAVDPRSGEFIDAVRGASDGGVDVVFDPVGGTTAATAMSALKRDGRILVVGLASGSTVPIDSLRLLLRNHTAIGVYAGGFSREADDDAWSSLQALAAARRITPQVRTVWQFDEVPAMIRGQDSPPAGKSVVIVSS